MDTMEQKIQKGIRTASRVIDGEAIIVFLGSEKIKIDEAADIIEHVNSEDIEKKWYRLDEEATLLWSLLDRKPKIKEIVDELVKVKRMDPVVAAEQVQRFVRKLAMNGFIDFIE